MVELKTESRARRHGSAGAVVAAAWRRHAHAAARAAPTAGPRTGWPPTCSPPTANVHVPQLPHQLGAHPFPAVLASESTIAVVHGIPTTDDERGD